MCKENTLQTDPMIPAGSCSNIYYRCDFKNGTSIWNLIHCQGNQVFSSKLQQCTYECDLPNPTGNCTTNGNDNMCRCIDDVGYLWIGTVNNTVQHLCSDYEASWISK